MDKVALRPDGTKTVFHDVHCNAPIVYNPIIKMCKRCLVDNRYDASIPHSHTGQHDALGNPVFKMGEWDGNVIEKKVTGQWCLNGHPNAKKWG